MRIETTPTTDTQAQARIVSIVEKILGGEVLEATVTPCIVTGDVIFQGAPARWFVELTHAKDGTETRYSGYASESGGLVHIDPVPESDPFANL